MFVLVTMKTSPSMDKDCWNALELFLSEAENAIECTISSVCIVSHHGGNFMVTAAAHALGARSRMESYGRAVQKAVRTRDNIDKCEKGAEEGGLGRSDRPL